MGSLSTVRTYSTTLRTTFWAELKTARRVLRHEGFRALFRKYGWKLFAVIFAYYIVRDVTLYIILPMVLFKSVT